MNLLHNIALPSFHDLASQSAKASLLACAVALLCLLPRRRLSPAWRHVLWCVVFVRLVLPDAPATCVSWNINRLLTQPVAMVNATPEVVVPGDAAESVPFLTAIPDPSPASSASPAQRNLSVSHQQQPVSPAPLMRQSSSLSWWSIAGRVWFAGAVAWWLALAGAWWRFRRRILGRSSEASPTMQSMLESCLEQTGVSARVQLRCSEHIGDPAVCGVFRPVILIPDGLEATLPVHELRLLLLHELGHVKRRDTLVQVCASVLLGLHWWNPVLWFAWNRLRQEAEAATDAWVLQRTGPEAASSYGAMLLNLASRACAAGAALLFTPSLLGAASRGGRLRQRLAAIVGHQPAKRWAALPGVATLVVLVITGFSQTPPTPETGAGKNPAPEKPAAIAEPASVVSTIGGLIVDEQGKPIQGAKIEVSFNRPGDHFVKSVLPDAAKKSETVESDAEGHWHLEGVPVGVVPETAQNGLGKDTYRFSIAHPDFLFEEFSGQGLDFGSDASFRGLTAKLVLKRGHIIRGVVRDERGGGIAGATVERNLTRRHGADPKATTDADGKYELKAARPGDFVIRVRAAGFALLQQRFTVSSDATLDFTLKPAKTLTLKLRDVKDQPLTKGYVALMPVNKPWKNGDSLWIASPDQYGVVVWNQAPAGDVIAVAHMDGFQRLEQQVMTGGEVVLSPSPKPSPPVVTIHVTSASTGQPLTGCIIEKGFVLRKFLEPLLPTWVGGQPRAPTTTSPGEYAVQTSALDLQELVIFRVRCEGHAPVMTAPMDLQKGNTTLTVALQERQSTTITVLKEDGSPAAKAKVQVAWSGRFRKPAASDSTRNLSRLMDISLGGLTPEFSGVTGEDGRCVLPACADDASVIAAGETGFTTAEYSEVMKNSTMKFQPYRGATDALFVRRTLRPSPGDPSRGRLHLQVLHEDKPVPANRVYTLACGDKPDDLAVVFTGFPQKGVTQQSFEPGTRNLQVGWRTEEGKNWFSPVLSAQVKSGEATEATVSLKPGIRVAGRVADEMPRPVKEARVLVFVSAEAGGALGKVTWGDWTSLCEDGSFEFPSLPPGHFQFLVMAEGWTSPFKPAVDGGRHGIWSAGLIPQSRDDLVIPMQPTGSCEVTVLDAAGNPVSGAAVSKSIPFSTNGFSGRVLFFNATRGYMLTPPTSLEDTLSGKFRISEPLTKDSTHIFTDAQGHATLRGLPPLLDTGKVMVIAPGIDIYTARNASASMPVGVLKPGETVKVTVSLPR